MTEATLTERFFSEADQQTFAVLSGDENPIHIDPVAARRTMAGQPVVHGVHLLLWALDAIFQNQQLEGCLAALSVKFDKMVFLDKRVRLVRLDQSGRDARFKVFVGSVAVLRLKLTFGAMDFTEEKPNHVMDDATPHARVAAPLDLTLAEMEGRHGCLAPSADSDGLATLFPAATKALGASRVAWLACSSYLVGMVCPGLHSIYGGLDLARRGMGADDALRFRVADLDTRFRRLQIAVSGCGWDGSLVANVRPAPTPQPSIGRLAEHVVAGEFSGTRALVIGGSRGLGELVCKLIAAGGGDVVLTYAVGKTDALRVQADIVGYGGRCAIRRYDVDRDAASQVSDLSDATNQLYYFPTPTIFQNKGKAFDAKRLETFLRFYVTGFADLCGALMTRTEGELAVFYPSSSFVGTRPSGMTEYAMAKAAGEVLCTDLQAQDRRLTVLVSRLPRLPTDQTASLQVLAMDDAVDTLLPILRRMRG